MTVLQKCSLGLILGSFVALALAYNVLQPMWEAPDESAHFGFIRYVQVHHALPRGDPNTPAQIDAWNPTSEYSQTPVYYLVLAVVLKPIRLVSGAQFHQNPYVAWPGHPWREAVALHRTDEGWPYHGLALFVHLGRLVSAVFGFLVLLDTFALVARITGRISDSLFATAWLAWTPGFLLASARLDNDSAAMVAGALTLLLCARLLTAVKPASRASLVALSVSLSLALLSKLDTAFLIPLVAISAFVAAEPGLPLLAARTRRLTTTLLVLALPVGLLAVWWLEVGQSFQARVGTAVGFGIARFWKLLGPTEASRLIGALWNLNATWWGGVGFGTLKPWPPAVYLILAIPLLGLLGVGGWAIANRCWWPAQRGRDRWVVALLGISTIPLFYATIARQALPAVSLDSNARFTLPAASAVALIVVLGGRYIPLGRLRRPLALAYLAGLLGLAIATAVILLPAIPAPRIPARLAYDESELTAAPLARFANGVDLAMVGELPPALPRGGTLMLNLEWRVAAPPERDFTAYVQLIDLDDNRKIAGSDSIPFQKTFPPSLWQQGEFVDDRRQLAIPRDLPPGHYRLLVGAYYLEQGKPRAISNVSPDAIGSAVAAGSWVIPPP